MAGYPRGDQINVLGPLTMMRDKTNNVPEGAAVSAEGVAGEYTDELSLEMSDSELLALAKEWTGDYRKYAGSITSRQDTNKQYYLGIQNQAQSALDTAPVPDNILFEASETFYAQALARQPDPIVYSDNTDAGTQESDNVRTMLVFLADSLKLRQKMKVMVRHWNWYFLGCLKHGWDASLHEITTEVRNPKNLLLDPDGYVDCDGSFIGWIGEEITAEANVLAEMYPDHEQYISEIVEYKMGTNVTWTEWWTDEYTFTTFKQKVLDKSLNPHFNYPKKMKENRGEQVVEVLKEGRNHFARPQKPYTFLSVFSAQEQPHDVTSLIEQNRNNQDYITERSRQIKRNAAKNNNSYVFSEAAGYNQEKAKQANDALEDGNGALSPINPAEAIHQFPPTPLPESFFKELEMRTQNLRSIYGTLGTTPIEQDSDVTARGMILNQQRASDRIGGTIGDALNQVAANVFNHWTQFMHVYYDMEHTAAVMGKLKAVEAASLTAEGFTRRLYVGASPDSTIPKDSITEANQALANFKAGLPVDPKTVLKLMDTPDIEKTVEGGLLWQLNKQAYIQQNFPELAQILGLAQPAPAPGAPPGGPAPILSPIQPQGTEAPPANPSLSQVKLPPLP